MQGASFKLKLLSTPTIRKLTKKAIADKNSTATAVHTCLTNVNPAADEKQRF